MLGLSVLGVVFLDVGFHVLGVGVWVLGSRLPSLESKNVGVCVVEGG